MIKLSINTKKIDESALFPGQKGKYLNIVLFERRDDFGNDGFAVQEPSKEQREAGTRGPIVGNWRRQQAGSASDKKVEERPETKSAVS